MYLLYEYKLYVCTYIPRRSNTFLRHYSFFLKIAEIGNESTSLGKIIDASLLGRQCDTPDRMN